MYKKNITMSDIAKAIGTSTVTVSKSLSDKDGVSEELRQRVKQVAKEMGYCYSSSSSSSSGSKNVKEGLTYNIGIIIANRYVENDKQSLYWQIYQRIIKQLTNHDYYGILELIEKEDEDACTVPNIIQGGRVDGVIVVGELVEKYIDMINSQNVPVIGIDFQDKEFKMDAVVSDNLYSSYKLTSYLIQQGHRKIGYIGNIRATSNILDRYLGYYKALVENGIEKDEKYVISDRDSNGKYFDFELPQDLPTALVCNCDEIAYHCIKRLQAQGIIVPEEVSVVGFDNHIYSQISTPPITTMGIDVDGMVDVAIDGLIKKVANPNYRIGRKVMMSELVLKESVRALVE